MLGKYRALSKVKGTCDAIVGKQTKQTDHRGGSKDEVS